MLSLHVQACLFGRQSVRFDVLCSACLHAGPFCLPSLLLANLAMQKSVHSDLLPLLACFYINPKVVRTHIHTKHNMPYSLSCTRRHRDCNCGYGRIWPCGSITAHQPPLCGHCAHPIPVTRHSRGGCSRPSAWLTWHTHSAPTVEQYS